MATCAMRPVHRRAALLVEKSNLRRLGDYTVRFFAAPVTVVLDAALAIVVIGAIAGAESLDARSRAGWR